MKKLSSTYRLPILIALLVLAADALSKYLTHHYLPVMQRYSLWYPYGGIPIFKNLWGIEFSISHQINTGAAWGMLSAYQMPLLYFRGLLIASLLIYMVFFNQQPAKRISFTLIIAGALGNVLDHYFYGHVVDMLHFVLWGYDFPVFNLADSAIFLGVACLLLVETLEPRKC